MALLGFSKDSYGGKVVSKDHVSAHSTVESFRASLKASLDTWTQQGTKGIWLHLPKERAIFLPAALEAGFDLHHTEPDRIVLTKWLPSSPNLLPGYNTHTAGVGCLVMNDRNEVLAVQERTGPASASAGAVGFWKTPTGLVEGGEDIVTAAVREVKEECGVDAEVCSVVAVREMHVGPSTNLYFVLLMRPVANSSEQIRKQESEIAAATWMPIAKFLEQATSRMPPGGVYYTLNLLAAIAGFGAYPHAWTPHRLELGPKLAPGVTNTVFFDPTLVKDSRVKLGVSKL
eukprot:gnl/TRDRNA2_/TRDRNA2_132656_c0_seq2.p1 gnl/TRDRNA2_/TRDRNA2_132656_c0~~gnl/TRDRNA2_/TRDRNA2_132656_c0_seq2.p1  ORF type:complete len:287 (+),score=46.59 gnl/TRDRNA2_/TRDRNA2_132656_c0_seq2:65-925(+)